MKSPHLANRSRRDRRHCPSFPAPPRHAAPASPSPSGGLFPWEFVPFCSSRFRVRRLVLAALLVGLLSGKWVSLDASAAEPASSRPLPAPHELSLSPEFQTLVAGLVRENLPDQFEDTRHWGQTKEVVTGLKIRHDGLRIQTKRRRDEVNHGSWKMYRVQVVNPDEQFRLRVDNVREAPDGRLAFEVETFAQLHAFGRWSQWQRGVQLISLSADADARVRIKADCRLGLHLDPVHLPPDVLLEPEVMQAEIQLVDFRLRKISDLRGPLVLKLGHALEDMLEDKLAERGHKLPEKLNRQIAKHRDKLRFSFVEMLRSPWAGVTRSLTADSETFGP
jgi:hypothetical protein